jgi:serine/threonine protein kinase
MELSEFAAPRGSVDFSELTDGSYYRNRTRRAFTTLLRNPIVEEGQQPCSYDFLTLISVACDVYKSNASDLVVMQAFQHGAEHFENSGMNCVVSRKAVTLSTPSNITRGRSEKHEANIVVKRIHEGVVEPGSRALKSFLAELRVRAHEPLRMHTNIVALRGIAWDFEDEDRRIPRPLLLEEYAPEGALSTFWTKKNLTRMPFKNKCSLALDIANGISALHACDVVHGDVKPENVLIFPKTGFDGEFVAKLTDFGHSVFKFEGRDDLPAFTLQYSAPEATRRHLSFEDMAQTDVYSYGLVALSLFLGRNACSNFGNQLAAHKSNDTLYAEAVKLIEREDREQSDSDLHVPTLKKLLFNSIRLDPGSRALSKCIRTLKRFGLTAEKSWLQSLTIVGRTRFSP